jgi:hypothetical protein
MKKVTIFITLLTSLNALLSAPYVGGGIVYNKLQTNAKLEGNDSITDYLSNPISVISSDYSISSNTGYNQLRLAFIGGYAFNASSIYKAFVEGSIVIGSKEIKTNSLSSNMDNVTNESFSIKNLFTGKIGGGIRLIINKNVEPLFLLNMGIHRYKLTIMTTSLNSLSKENIVGHFFIEPTVGININVKRLTIRIAGAPIIPITAASTKNYAKAGEVATASFSIKPSGYIVQTAVLFNF